MGIYGDPRVGMEPEQLWVDHEYQMFERNMLFSFITWKHVEFGVGCPIRDKKSVKDTSKCQEYAACSHCNLGLARTGGAEFSERLCFRECRSVSKMACKVM